MRRTDPANLRSALWALRAARRARNSLRREPLENALGRLPRVPGVPSSAGRGVQWALRIRDDTCLVRAIVVQSWEATHGERRDLVIGVKGPRDFKAHAWLEGDPESEKAGFTEIHRHPAPR